MTASLGLAPMGRPHEKRRKTIRHDSEQASVKPIVGLVLLDYSLKPIAANVEAASILNAPDAAALEQQVYRLVSETLSSDGLPARGATEPLPPIPFKAAKRRYVCQPYPLVPSVAAGATPFMILVLQQDVSFDETIGRIAAEYHLTEREQEALHGISLGLTSRDLAERMGISPNTVKAYLRLIMVKMGVGTRAAIVAKILNTSVGSGTLSTGERAPSIMRAGA